MIDSRQLVLREASQCGQCPVSCGEGKTVLGCSPDFQPAGGFASHVLHASAPDFLDRIVECNGLDLNIDARPQSVPPLPRYLPQIRPWKRIQDLGGVATVALPLSAVMRLATTMQSTGRSAKSLLGLAHGQQLIVTGFAHDRFLERAWPRPARTRLMRAIQTIEPDVAIAWGYSVWHHDIAGRPYPRPDHLYNLKRSLLTYEALQNLGVVTIPHLYWGLQKDLDRWSEWLARNSCVSAIAIDLQTVDRDVDWADVLRDVAYFERILPRDIRCVFNGICQVNRVRQLREVWPNSSLCNFGPFFAVVFPHKDLFGLQPIRGEGPARSYAQIFRDVFDQYTALMVAPEPMATPSAVSDPVHPDVRMLGPNSPPFKQNGVFQRPLFSSDLDRPARTEIKGAA